MNLEGDAGDYKVAHPLFFPAVLPANSQTRMKVTYEPRDDGEDVAALRFDLGSGSPYTVGLVGQGMVVLDRNWRCELGEIDLVARDGDALVVCEVKTRSGLGFGHPLETVTAVKLARPAVEAAIGYATNMPHWLAVAQSTDAVLRLATEDSGAMTEGLNAVEALASLGSNLEAGRLLARLVGSQSALQRGQLPFLRKASWRVYDKYLRANRVEEGIRSYGKVITLILRARFEDGWVPVRKPFDAAQGKPLG
jgi:Holliday junction resolvase-like predicted endonuclease